jgi:hypothetical protein
LAACFCLRAQQPADQTPAVASTNSPADQIAALQLQFTNAWLRVCAIVGQPVQAYQTDNQYPIAIYPGWFHPGAEIPDFNTVDVRQSQQFPYESHQYVSSDQLPALMFKGADLEFNAMTKLFYTNRSLPKKRLTEDEMVEINSQYRIIGHCQDQIRELQAGPIGNRAAALESSDDDDSTNDVASGQMLAGLRGIPRKTRLIYGGIVIGVLIVIFVVSRLFGKKGN